MFWDLDRCLRCQLEKILRKLTCMNMMPVRRVRVPEIERRTAKTKTIITRITLIVSAEGFHVLSNKLDRIPIEIVMFVRDSVELYRSPIRRICISCWPVLL